MSQTDDSERSAAASPAPYRVLARKYRPRSFDDLIGQEPMVRTLTNAFESGRIAQAWMLTGVRGVGKTTTARILARALNYETGTVHRPTIRMTEPGVHDAAIMEGRHVDVVEMDAASHTGIDDIREIIQQVRYRPVSARYKVTIIDEVHMLSTQAFNGLLKTLEEPPEHAKFVFATTEIRKVPVTILSRCQRFDLRRVEAGALMAHLARVLAAESVEAEEDGLRVIARAAEGSVRDALSLTDQAIAHGAGVVTAGAVRDMLGLADRVRVIDLFEHLMRGDAAAALAEFAEQYAAGADPVAVLTDLASFTHLVTQIRFAPDSADDASLSPAESGRGRALAGTLSVRALGQAWQMLLKAIEETRASATPREAVDMALIRIAFAADLPSPDELLRALDKGAALPALPPLPPAVQAVQPAPPPASSAILSAAPISPIPAPRPASPQQIAPDVSQTIVPQAVAPQAVAPQAVAPQAVAPQAAAPQTAAPQTASPQAVAPEPVRPAPSLVSAPKPASPPPARAPLGLVPASVDAPSRPESARTEPEAPGPASLAELDALAKTRRDSRMRLWIRRYLRLVAIEPGRLEVVLAGDAPASLPNDLARRLHEWTGRRWVVSLSASGGGATLEEEATARRERLHAEAEADPEVAAVLAAFPGASVREVRLRGVEAGAAPPSPLAEEEIVSDDDLPAQIDADPGEFDLGFEAGDTDMGEDDDDL